MLPSIDVRVCPWLPATTRDADGNEVPLLGVLVSLPAGLLDLEVQFADGSRGSVPRLSPEQAARRSVFLTRPEIAAQIPGGGQAGQ